MKFLRLPLFVIVLTGTLQAQVPRLINYQGRVAVGAVNFDGPGLFKFALIDNAGVTTYWSNDGTSAAGGEPVNSVSLAVSKGLYSVLLGDAALANMTAIPAIAFTHADVRLRVWFNDGVNGSQLLTPDQRLAPASYLASGAVTAETIADAAISTAKIAPGAINGTHVAPASLDFSRLSVPNPPTAGQVLAFDGAGLNWIPAAGGGGDSVFSLNGTNAYYLPGNVGLGTTTPTSKLEIAAQDGLKLIGFNPFLTLTDTNANNARTAIQSVAGGLNFFTENYLNGANPFGYMRLDGTGKVGIGTAVPQATLEVVGQDAVKGVGYQPFFTLADSNAGYARSIIQGVAGDMNLFTESYLNGSNPFAFLHLENSGNIGMGTAAPSSKLDVSGDITATRLVLRADPAAPANAAILCTNAAVENFVPYNTANNRPLSITVRTLTITGGADLAEPFPMKETEIEKGSVVVIDETHPGRLKRSTRAYDRRVAGIVSGANGVNPGISLHQDGLLDGGQNVALTGRVYVHGDASFGPIKPGDLLTTSDTPGHAMKVIDHTKAQGAILGKAMSALDEGTGMVLVLVTLQ